MIAVAEATPDVIPPVRRFTVADYYRMAEAGVLHPDERVELIKGEIRVMSPQGPKHASSGARADRCFQRLLADRADVRIQLPIHLADDSEPEPDIVLAMLDEDDYAEHHPTPAEILLVLEISASTLNYDRKEKSLLYAQAGITEYCLLNLNAREMENYRDPSPAGYRSKHTYEASEYFSPAAFPDLSIKVADLLPRLLKVRNESE